jgi:hypothetical protein
MLPLHNLSVHDCDLATFWIDADGILFARAKPTRRTMENQVAAYDLIRKMTDGHRICMIALAASTPASDELTQDIHEYMAAEMPKLFRAMAVVAATVQESAPAIKFMNLHNQPIPICIVSSIDHAREWLKPYMD